MSASRHINFATPLPANAQPAQLLGRLVLDPQLTAANLNGQLSPATHRVAIRAQIRHEPYTMSEGLQAQKHVFSPGPARVWNAMLANERSIHAILGVVSLDQEAWLITAVFIVDGKIAALDYERVSLVDARFVIELQDPCEYRLVPGTT